jgi:hypothetical protein
MLIVPISLPAEASLLWIQGHPTGDPRCCLLDRLPGHYDSTAFVLLSASNLGPVLLYQFGISLATLNGP